MDDFDKPTWRSGFFRVKGRRVVIGAGVAELVDALDLGSSDESRVGSSPSARTILYLSLSVIV